MNSLKVNLNKNLKIVFVLAFVLILSGCASTIDVGNCLPEKIYGFWWGLLHGFISFFTFIISLFKDEVAIYAVNNNGGWYDFGFILGIMCFYGGGSKASCKNK
jgi:uncharacterized membrane protein HdeD (DUF308 family)